MNDSLPEQKIPQAEVIAWECAQLSTPWNDPEKTLLDIANESDIELVSACGGKTICSTCRIEVLEGLELLAPRSPEEQRIAERLHWAGNIRLGCATRLCGEGNIRIRRLIKPPGERKLERRRARQGRLGLIRELAILFVDLRGFTPLSERIPAFDLVYILNRYFTALKEEIVGNGGTINLWAGDEMSCVFGINESRNYSYCEDAVRSALAIRRRIAVLSEAVTKEFGVSLDVGIGIHTGPVVVGNLGPADDLRFGIVGDAVNVASRVERKTRDLGCGVLITRAVKEGLRESRQLFPQEVSVSLKGVSESLQVFPCLEPA